MYIFIYIGLSLLCWSLMTWVPLGRMKLSKRIKTNADLKKLRVLYTGKQRKLNWYPGFKTTKIVTGTNEDGIEFTDYIFDDPLPAEDEPYKYYHREIITHEDDRNIKTKIPIAMGVELPENEHLYENLSIEQFEDHSVVKIEQDIMRHGLLGSANSQNHLERYMNCLIQEAGDTLHNTEKPKVRFLALWSIPLMMGAGYYFLNGWFGFFAASVLSLVILLHELGHGLAMRLFGHKYIDIALIPFGGGIAMSNQPYKSRFEMAMIALAGPLVSAIFIILLVITNDVFNIDKTFKFLLVDDPMNHVTEMIANLIALSFVFVMLLLNVINLFPKRGLDGGEVIAAISSSKKEFYALALFFGAMVVWLTYKLDLPIWVIIIEIVLITILLRRSSAMNIELPLMTSAEKITSLSMLSLTFAIYLGTILIAEHKMKNLPNSLYFKQYMAQLETVDE